MAILIAGLAILLGAHTFTMMRGARAGIIARMGEGPYKLVYSAISLLGVVLIVYGYGSYRASSGYLQIWNPPVWMRHLALTLMLVSFVLLAASWGNNRIRRIAKHPMLAAVKVWAFAHLLANGDLGSIVLFGSFLAYAVVDRIALKRRPADPAPAGIHGAALASNGWLPDITAIGLGVGLYVLFVLWLHTWLIGVPVINPT